MTDCLNKHEQCCVPKQPLTYPTRLLELYDDIVRLVVPKGLGPICYPELLLRVESDIHSIDFFQHAAHPKTGASVP